MTSLECARAGAWMTAAEAGTLDEADACRLEEHLARCEGCRRARVRLAGVASLLREAPGAALGAAALDRALERALSGRSPARRLPSRFPAFAVAAVAASMVAAVAWWAVREKGEGEGEGEAESQWPQVEEIVAARDTTIRLEGVRVVAEAGSRVLVERGASVLALREGRVRVSVRPGVPLTVRTDRFTVTVAGTRFAVTVASVEVWAGRVRVHSPAMDPWADLRSGERWRVPETAVARAAPVADPAPVPASAMPSTSPRTQARARTAAEPLPTIEDVQGALRERRTAEARRMIDRLLPSAGAGAGAAQLATLRADSLRLERRHTEAARAYRDVADRYHGSPFAETALFGAAQIEVERRPTQARRTLLEYQRRYPQGRFRTEVERLLERISP